ncbi:stage II sporulation protein R [Heyndrickxia sp. NPDC080065]|uniref:stage II sporulation protein R n=1 Tax=Heyndrickxia sp. NPDC080065 TaxID=3390568 RepID=UPI003D060F63
MNKQNYAWIYIMILSIGTILSLYIPKQEIAAKEAIVIPKEAVRLRILANSDTEKDQSLKRKIRDEVNKEITKWVENLTSIEDARKVIKAHLPEIEKIAKQVIREEKSNQSVRVEFGQVQFPTKLYGQFLYPAGEYEAVLITLGKGEGANWWCVLYPPLCFMDFSNGVAVSPGFDGNNENAKETSKEPTTEKQQISDENKKSVINKDQTKKQKQPLYVKEEEDQVKVKFFIVELFKKIF